MKETEEHIPNLVDISRIEKQRNAIASTEPFICLSGGIRSGKTWSAILKGLLLLQLVPGNRGFLGRLDGKDLRLSTMRDFDELCPRSWIDKKNDQLGYIRFKNGSELIYGDLKDLEGKRGLTISFAIIDQAEELQDDYAENEVIPFFNGRLSHPKSERRYLIFTCNPGGHNWIWKRFKKPLDEGKPLANHALFEMVPHDNPFLPADYLDNLLKSGMPDYWIKRYVYGSWDVFSDQVYPQFDSMIHGIPFGRLDLHPAWTIDESIDHGLVSPTSYHQYAMDYDGNVFAYEEHYEGGKAISYHANVIKTKRGKRNIRGTYLDPTAFSRTQSKGARLYSIADEYVENGIYPVAYNNDWSLRYNRMCEYLKVDPEHKHPISGLLGAPHFYVMDNCGKMIEEFINYKWKKIRPGSTSGYSEDPVDHGDHAMDECSGWLATRPAPPTPPKKKSFFDELRETGSAMSA